MSKLQSKRFGEPDEVLTLPNVAGQIVVLGDVYVGRFVHQPGFRWSVDVKPVAATPSCQHHHQGVVLSGYIQFTMDDGSQRTIGPGEVYSIPPGHDAQVIGDEPCTTIDFRGVRSWGRSTAAGERILATLVLTDIVGSTALAARIGDAAWKEFLGLHGERVRAELDRYRGNEIDTKGDEFLTLFDGAARAVRFAAAVCRAAREQQIEVRAGVHSGEVEWHVDALRGIAVHAVARIAALARPSEVLVSASTVSLVEGSGLSFADAGEHELKGLSGLRRLYRLSTGDSTSSSTVP